MNTEGVISVCGRVEITTKQHTDLWQRTYYHFQNDNAPVFQMETEEQYFSFVVKTEFTESCHRFDQCGIVMYLDSENRLNASVEYENEKYQHLGSVVTNGGSFRRGWTASGLFSKKCGKIVTTSDEKGQMTCEIL